MPSKRWAAAGIASGYSVESAQRTTMPVLPNEPVPTA